MVKPPVVDDRSHDATIDDRSHDATIDRAFDRCTQRLTYDQPPGATTDRTLGHMMPLVLVRSATCSMP